MSKNLEARYWIFSIVFAIIVQGIAVLFFHAPSWAGLLTYLVVYFGTYIAMRLG